MLAEYSQVMSSHTPLIQIVDRALAEAQRKAGPWLACRPGCYQCCVGPFGISAQDAERLREGLANLEPDRAARVRERARQSAERLASTYTLEQLLTDEDAAADEPCPALDPQTATCDLYSARPITCRTFGPPLRFADDAAAICELCFVA